MAEVRVKRGSAWIIVHGCSLRVRAFITQRNATGWHSAMLDPMIKIASLGGATMDNEWNYVQCKLMRALGVVFIENQARI